jgi:hypothetical protein
MQQLCPTAVSVVNIWDVVVGQSYEKI